MVQAGKSTAAASSSFYLPSVRRSSSSLSIMSLELCTENLGSETGSECTTVERSPPPWFSFSPPSSPSSNSSSFCLSPISSSDESSEKDFVSLVKEAKRERLMSSPQAKSVNYNCATSRKSPARSFPTPLPSISRVDGPCLHVKPHRQGGRLFLQAVEVSSHSYLHAQREGGRLRLSFACTPQRRKNQSDGESCVQMARSIRAAESDTEETIDLNEEGTNDDFSEGYVNKLIDHEFEEEEEEEHIEEKNELKVLGVFNRTVPKVVSIERSGRRTVPALVELHRLLGKIVSQPFVNMNPWTTRPQKKVAVIEFRRGGGDHGKERGVTQRLNVYQCLWREGEGGGGAGGGGMLAEGKAPSPAVRSQDSMVKEVSISELSHTRCCDPRRTHHHLLILERFCVATT